MSVESVSFTVKESSQKILLHCYGVKRTRQIGMQIFCSFQVVNPKLMETLRQQVQSDMEKPFREKVLQVDAELEKSRSDYKKLKYDYTFLKSEYEHESSEHKRIIDKLTLRYEAEVSSLLLLVITYGLFGFLQMYIFCIRN